MRRLDGKVALVLGGAGFVGEGIVRSFLEEGAFTIVPSRSAERLQALRERGFSFVGPTICYAFMQAVGMVDDHLVTCFRRTGEKA